MAKNRKPKPPRTPEELTAAQEAARAARAEQYRAILERDVSRVRRESEQLRRDHERVRLGVERVSRESERVSRETEGLIATLVRFLLELNPYPPGCEAWTVQLQARPTDGTLLGAFSDWLDEQTGGPTTKSAALRAMALRLVAPERRGT